jgi:small subunit ribosomal protein S20
VKSSISNLEEEEKSKVKAETVNIVNKVYSIIDKAVKKGVIHRNTAARKKSRIGKMFIKM